MRFGDTIVLEWAKDGGPQSKVDGFWFFRSKTRGTLALLKFNDGSREAFHSHAFDAVSWLLRGFLVEETYDEDGYAYDECYEPSPRAIITPRSRFHKVTSIGTSWVLTVRGPWADTWEERNEQGQHLTLTHNRKVVSHG